MNTFVIVPILVSFADLLVTTVYLFRTKKSAVTTAILFFFNAILFLSISISNESIFELSGITTKLNPSIYTLNDLFFLFSLFNFTMATFSLSTFRKKTKTIVNPYIAIMLGIIMLMASAILIMSQMLMLPVLSVFLKPEIYFMVLFPAIIIFPIFILHETLLLRTQKDIFFKMFVFVFTFASIILYFNSFNNPIIDNLPFLPSISLPRNMVLNIQLYTLPTFFLSFILLSKSRMCDSMDLNTDLQAGSQNPILPDFITKLFGKKTTPPAITTKQRDEEAEMMRIITYIFSLVPDKKNIPYEFSVMTALKNQHENISEDAFLSIYPSLEEFIVNNKPPMTAGEFSRETLHQLVKNNFNTELLPHSIKILFATSKLQALHTVEMGLSDMGSFLSQHLGQEKYDEVIKETQFDEISKDIIITDQGVDFSILNKKIMDAKDNPDLLIRLTAKLKSLYARLFVTVKNETSRETAFKVIENSIARLDKMKDAVLAQEIYEAIPENERDDNLISFSKNMMEDKIRERTDLLEKTKTELEEKITQMEQQKRDLEREKENSIRLLEESKRLGEELAYEKNSVEEKVKQRTFELDEEKAKMSAAISSLPVGLIITDLSENIISFNTQAQKILKVETRTNNLNDLEKIFDGDFNIREIYLKSQVQRQTIEVNDLLFKNKFLHLSVTPIFNELDRRQIFIGTLILVDDVTEGTLLNRSRDEFFSIASHELRTPLTAIRGNTVLIGKLFKSKIAEPKLFEMVDDIHKSCISLIGIVNEFLNLSRLEQGKITFSWEEFDIWPEIEEVTKQLDTVAKEKNLALILDKPGQSLGKIKADRERAKEILVNLISNAIKYTDQGQITIKAVRLNDTVEIDVSDTGRGISLENQTMLFRKFQQANKDMLTRDTTKSTGLGLYISKLISESMKCKVFLKESVPGKGSTFSFVLPVVDN